MNFNELSNQQNSKLLCRFIKDQFKMIKKFNDKKFCNFLNFRINLINSDQDLNKLEGVMKKNKLKGIFIIIHLN